MTLQIKSEPLRYSKGVNRGQFRYAHGVLDVFEAAYAIQHAV